MGLDGKDNDPVSLVHGYESLGETIVAIGSSVFLQTLMRTYQATLTRINKQASIRIRKIEQLRPSTARIHVIDRVR
jgi:hypothetical protein